ncbi:MAG TPA: hypothetical protein VK149_03570 [Sideroxyarcus sp.]|nr:hypothetical protein [Sideroxyarcus sp.]
MFTRLIRRIETAVVRFYNLYANTLYWMGRGYSLPCAYDLARKTLPN